MASELEKVAELLPEIVHDFIGLVGFADTEKLINRFGGATFRFSDGAVYYPMIVELLGSESAVKLRHYFKSEYVYIPRCEVALKALRNQQFKADYDYLLNQQSKSGRQAMLELCPKYKISDRLGWMIVGKMSQPSEQASLF